jgi:hypothetical protein
MLTLSHGRRRVCTPVFKLTHYPASGYFAMARFADPTEVLALPKPKLPILANAWHYARGEVLARRGDAAGVRAEANAIVTPIGKVNDDDGSRVALQLTFLARNVLLGRAAMLDHRFSDASVIFKQAADMQEGEEFSMLTDPPAWYYPIRYDVATALLASGDRAGAIPTGEVRQTAHGSTSRQRRRSRISSRFSRAKAIATMCGRSLPPLWRRT